MGKRLMYFCCCTTHTQTQGRVIKHRLTKNRSVWSVNTQHVAWAKCWVLYLRSVLPSPRLIFFVSSDRNPLFIRCWMQTDITCTHTHTDLWEWRWREPTVSYACPWWRTKELHISLSGYTFRNVWRALE